MRLFLDAHISPARIAAALRDLGHLVRAAAEEAALDSWDDERLLALAAQENRIFVTFNVKDFPRIAGEWAQAGRHHAGCAVVVGVRTDEFSLTVRRLSAALKARPRQADWDDLLVFVTRSG